MCAALARKKWYNLLHMSTQIGSKPLAQLISSFLDYCEVEKGLADSTQRTYANDLKLFTDWLHKTGNADLLPHELTNKHVWNYRLYLARSYKDVRKKHLSKKSQNYKLIALRAFLDFLAE